MSERITITLTRDEATAIQVALRSLSRDQRTLRPIGWPQERMTRARLDAENAISAALARARKEKPMQSDEQRMREQFEKWIDEKQYGLGWQDGRGTWEEFLSATWAGYKAGQLARAAEVQKLREALTEVTEDLASEFLAKHGPIQAHPDTVRSFDREMEPVRRARKLLAGEEATDE